MKSTSLLTPPQHKLPLANYPNNAIKPVHLLNDYATFCKKLLNTAQIIKICRLLLAKMAVIVNYSAKPQTFRDDDDVQPTVPWNFTDSLVILVQVPLPRNIRLTMLSLFH